MLKNFSDVIEKAIQLKDGRTTSQFARDLGMQQSTLDLYLKGKRKPSLELVYCICRSMGVSADWLLGLPERGVSLANSSNNAVNSDHASITVDSPNCRDCPHLLRLIDLLAAERSHG